MLRSVKWEKNFIVFRLHDLDTLYFLQKVSKDYIFGKKKKSRFSSFFPAVKSNTNLKNKSAEKCLRVKTGISSGLNPNLPGRDECVCYCGCLQRSRISEWPGNRALLSFPPFIFSCPWYSWAFHSFLLLRLITASSCFPRPFFPVLDGCSIL